MQHDYGYIDIHCHIIPGVDDGAASMEQTKEMLQMAYDEGIRTIIATPHFSLSTSCEMSFLLQQFGKVQEEARKIDPDFRIYLGNELYYEQGCIAALNEGAAFTLAESRYVLVEFHPQEGYPHIYEGMRELIQEGYLPIIAHIERYACLKKQEQRIADLIELGCCMQINAKSLAGGLLDFQAAWLRRLVAKGMISFIATDSHNTEFRPPAVRRCIEKLSRCVDEEIIKEVFYENPNKILNNEFL